MKYVIDGVKRTVKAKKDGSGTWTLVQIKLAGLGETIFEVNGFGTKEVEKWVKGTEVNGYLGERHWGDNGVTKCLNKIDALYVYNLLVKQFPGIDGVAAPAAAELPANDWGTPAAEPAVSDGNEPDW